MDEDALHVQAQRLFIADAELVLERELGGEEEQRLELGRALGGEDDALQRRFVVAGQVRVETLVFVLGDLGFGAQPDRLHGVQRVVLDHVLAVLVLGLVRHADRVFDEVGVFADHGRHGPVFEVVLEIVFQVQGHGRAGGVLLRLGHGERVDAFGFPQVRLVLARLLRQHGHLVGGHERGVEPDAELSDELGRGRGILLLRLLQFGEESARTGMCDGAEVFDQFFLRHADAVVGDRQRAGGLVGGDADLALAGEFGTGQRQETPFVQRVGGVRDQLAQEDLLI